MHKNKQHLGISAKCYKVGGGGDVVVKHSPFRTTVISSIPGRAEIFDRI